MYTLLSSGLKICNGVLNTATLEWIAGGTEDENIAQTHGCATRVVTIKHWSEHLWLVELRGKNRSDNRKEYGCWEKLKITVFGLQGPCPLRILIPHWFRRKCIKTFFTIIIPWMRHTLCMWCGLDYPNLVPGALFPDFGGCDNPTVFVKKKGS